jgi:hypothetical protein
MELYKDVAVAIGAQIVLKAQGPVITSKATTELPSQEGIKS